MGWTLLHFKMGQFEMTQKYIIIDRLSTDLLLGTDALQNYDMVINYLTMATLDYGMATLCSHDECVYKKWFIFCNEGRIPLMITNKINYTVEVHKVKILAKVELVSVMNEKSMRWSLQKDYRDCESERKDDKGTRSRW
jgi:hypothetical protein